MIEIGLVLGIAAAILVRLTIADRIFGPSILFYATPLPLMAVVAVANGFVFRRRPGPAWRRSVRRLLPIILLLWTVTTNCGWHRAAPRDVLTSRVAFWNAGRGHGGWDEIADEIRSWNADAVVLVEGGSASRTQREFWRSAFPDHQATFLGSGMVVLSREPVTFAERIDPSGDAKLGLIRMQLAGHPITVLAVDVRSTPFYSRRGVLQSIAMAVETYADGPLLVAGDFNTPADSALLTPLRRHCNLAFDRCGHGYEPSWPLPLPVLTIDQIWSNEHIDPRRCERHWTTCSDHRPVVVDVAIP